MTSVVIKIERNRVHVTLRGLIGEYWQLLGWLQKCTGQFNNLLCIYKIELPCTIYSFNILVSMISQAFKLPLPGK